MITIGLQTTEESRPSDSSIAVITLKISHIFNNSHTAINSDLSTITSSKANKGKNGRWLPLGVVAQWQSTGGSSQRPWVRFPAAPLFLSSPCRFKGLRTVTAQIVSFITHDHYRSLDHGGVPSIGLRLKSHIFDITCMSIMLYNCSSWAALMS